MSERIDPVRAVGDRRVWIRRDGDRDADQRSGRGGCGGDRRGAPACRFPSPRRANSPIRASANGFVAFVAQVLGQPGQKKGLRGGPETLEKARSAYLETEWSGPADRRPARGKITKTEI